MSRIETTIVIDRPIEQVWSFLVDPRNLPLWSPDADEVTGLPEGPLARDATLTTSGRIGRLPMRATLRVTEFEPHRAIELRSVSAPLGGSLATRVDLERSGGSTRLIGTSVARGLPRLLAALDPARQRDRDARFATLKQVIESRTEPARTAVERAMPSQSTLERAAAAHAPAERTPAEDTPPGPPPAREDPLPAEGSREPDSAAALPEPTLVAGADPTAPTAAEDGAGAAARLAPANEAIEVESGTDVPGPDPAATAGPSLAAPREDQSPEAPAAEPELAPHPAAPPDTVPQRTAVEGTRLVLRLEALRGPGATFEVSTSGATVGRAPENTVRLDDLSVSRRHARITYRGGGYWLSDLKSTGGTWLDGTKLTAPRRLAAGQTIGVGILRLRVFAAGAELPAADGPPPAEQATGRRPRRR